MADCVQQSRLLALPAEIRMSILELLFPEDISTDYFSAGRAASGIILNERYRASLQLHVLQSCRQLYQDGGLLAFQRTAFVVNSLFVANSIIERLEYLQSTQLGSLRSITFVADARHFRKLIDWGQHPFGNSSLQLDTLTIVLQRSSFWHYLMDFTSDIVQLLRALQGVKRFVFVRNQALVKGSFKTWCNRLIGLIMKIDHHERYNTNLPNLEKVWWTWSYDEAAHSFALNAQSPKPLIDEESYFKQILPLLEALRISIESEEWNPDPRSWNGT
ncbi:hypothetical protein BAUCODRAFT_132905 [Baudoinia panamericana UAMH 10762]|uniref:F-box domain-containing protein n=1 Tax=Baudoinia panamericana (strain UAMH 10762) TaxID=717646 RepID=M2MC04_BAUPA|nr:uncharacterized protein BAUCODRAFT_132905 [Baudoinia panamericana UAMH 10762]EMC94011.1 hypothetical protein BAUCODRAFT_132905 [Baudoinia panamericana UAMH 10762]